MLPESTKRWLLDDDPTPLVARLHHRVQFVGEMLKSLEQPMTTADLRRLAGEQYFMGWETNTQIDNRRGWLQSAGLIRRDSDGLLRLTDDGSGFLDRVVVQPALDRQNHKPGDTDGNKLRDLGAVLDRGESEPRQDLGAASLDRTTQIAREVNSAATDSKNPTRFERALRDAFRYLGFAAEHLGGSGQTDVLVDARSGGDASYRVAIDAKTTSASSLQDHQVDWDTLTEHQRKHAADYSMLVGPNPAGGRLMERAQQHNVAVLSAEALAGLCELHSARPLGLADYRIIFVQSGEVDLSEIEERTEEANRLVALAKRLIDAIADLAQALGPLTANQLRLTMYHQDSEDLPTQAEVETTLAALANPLVGAIVGDPHTGYVLACSPIVTASRLGILGSTLTHHTDSDPDN
ncbi:MAG: restriction endonuclease [Acidimicrobiaceae bacterium]|nr:restriction endonuclease [Acidimicrobiaceae bacterium]